MVRFYKIQGCPLTLWGDYGDILQHGMTGPRVGGLISLERTGPYMPPITFPGLGDVILNEAGRALLEASQLSGFSFQAVKKTKVVDLRWHEWDLINDEPPEFPGSGEPEDYIYGRPSSDRVAQEIGAIWELVVPISARVGRPRRIVQSFRELYVELDSWRGADVFRGDGYGGVLVTEKAKLWFDENLALYTQCEEFNWR